MNATNVGGTGSWSNVWNFTTIPNIPAQVALSSPASGTQNASLTPTLGWSVTPKAGSFTLQVSTGSDFSSTVTSMSGLPGLVEQVGPLADSVEYDWRVNATNAGGTGSWSLVLEFYDYRGAGSRFADEWDGKQFDFAGSELEQCDNGDIVSSGCIDGV